MTAADRRLAEAIARRLARLEPAMRRAYLAAIAQLQAELGTSYVLRALEGGFDPVTDPMLDRAFGRMRAEIVRGVDEAWRVQLGTLAATIPGAAEVAATFNVTNPRIVDALNSLERQILRTAKDEVRETVRQHIQAGLRSGTPPKQIAKGVRDVVGLSPSQGTAVRNFRAALEGRDGRNPLTYTLRDRRYDEMIKRVRKAKGTLTPEQIDKMVGVYERRFIKHHAETIARTATLNAQREGQDASMREMVADGLMEADRVTKTWVTVGDNRVRDSHRAMQGETVLLDRPFTNEQMIPNEWNCRCIVRYTVIPMPARQASLRRAPTRTMAAVG